MSFLPSVFSFFSFSPFFFLFPLVSLPSSFHVFFSLAPETRPQKKSHIQNDLVLVFQKKRLRLDTKSKCQYDHEVHRQKNSHSDDALILELKIQTHAVKVITIRLRLSSLTSFLTPFLEPILNLIPSCPPFLDTLPSFLPSFLSFFLPPSLPPSLP